VDMAVVVIVAVVAEIVATVVIAATETKVEPC
jgi:hypothetical protein